MRKKSVLTATAALLLTTGGVLQAQQCRYVGYWYCTNFGYFCEGDVAFGQCSYYGPCPNET